MNDNKKNKNLNNEKINKEIKKIQINGNNEFKKISELISSYTDKEIQKLKSNLYNEEQLDNFRNIFIKYDTSLVNLNKSLSKIIEKNDYLKNFYYISTIIEFKDIYDIVNSIDFTSILKKYNTITQKEIDSVQINDNGTIQYSDEIISIDNCKNEIIEKLDKVDKDVKSNNKSEYEKDKKIVVVFKWLLENFIMPLIVGLVLIPAQIKSEVETSFENYIKNNELEKISIEKQKEMFKDNFVQVTALELNVRESASSNSRPIGKLYQYQCARVIEKVPYWTKIEYTNKEKNIRIVGWVFNKYIKQFDEETCEWLDF